MERLLRQIGCALTILVVAITSPPLLGADEPTIDFDREIRPILSDRCFICHGPDEDARQADLRLDDEQVAKDLAIDVGAANDSQLIIRVTSADPDEVMPPPTSKLPPLNQQEIRLLRQWINEGAQWSKHWSFQPLPEAVATPAVQRTDWVESPIDRFVLHRLESAALRPAPAADKERLIRRLSFDLRGLPPSLTELDAFLQDASPNAYEQWVDAFLASEHYGERMAADWLDVARYSDTYGYQVDRDRFVWPWRDWVIRAFNRNLPYDKFVTLQLAGDLIPNAAQDDILATTFNRLHPQKVEGGSVPEEFRTEYVVDRTQTFATAFLGLTMECCRCHDHKYDPLSQREFYELSAFFDNIDEAGLYSYFTSSIPTPTLRMTTPEKQQQLAALRAAAVEAEARLATLAESRASNLEEWLAGQTVSHPQESGDALPIPGQVAHLDFEGDIKGPNQQVPGRIGKAAQLTGDDAIGLEVGNFRRWQPFSVSLWMQTPDEKDRGIVFHRSRAWTDAGSRGYQLMLEDGRLSASLIHFWPGNAIRVRMREKLPTNVWRHVTVTYDGSSRATGLNIFVDGKLANTEVVRDNLYKQIAGGGGDNITIGERFRDRGFTNGMVDEFKVFDRQLTELEIAHVYSAKPLTLTGEDDQERWAEYYLATVDASYREQRKLLDAARQKYNEAQDGLEEIMVMAERPVRRKTYLLERGAYDALGEEVSEGTPAILPPFPTDAPHNRLGLAQWLTSQDHPLAARVAANRLWQILFSHGLVRSPEDFGSQGTRPTHPELLDWLARDLVDSGWDIKRMLKQIVMSATYRQSSQASNASRERDPQNRLLSHYPAQRLSAEMLRDNVLRLSGLLVDRIGGPPAKPYEVEVSFKPTGKDKGDGLYRRSLYTYWKRTGPAPALMTLDASKRDVCRVKRERTTSPLQAFVLMNGPQFVEAARALGESLIEKHGEDTHKILSDLFRRMTSCHPNKSELAVLNSLYHQQWKHFESHAADARNYVSVGESQPKKESDLTRLAAITSVTNALLVYDEAIMKR